MKTIGKLILSILILVIPVICATASGKADGEAEKYVIVGATQQPEEHIYTQAQIKFGEFLKNYYDGDVEVVVHHSGDLGGEKDFFEFMMQGVSVDYAIVAPSWISTWDKQAAFMDTPFLWDSVDHWNKGLSGGVFEPIEKNLLDSGVRILGYAGGGVRNMILKDPVYSVDDFPNVLMRVMGSPIQARVFNATGIQATPMDYGEVYNAVKTGVVDGLENEASSLPSKKFYEVAPYIILTQHSITVRPFCFSEKRFQSFPPDLQEAILKAGADAAKWARDTESSGDWATLQKFAAEGKITLVEFDNTEMNALAQPVVDAYAAELGVEDILNNIKALK